MTCQEHCVSTAVHRDDEIFPVAEGVHTYQWAAASRHTIRNEGAHRDGHLDLNEALRRTPHERHVLYGVRHRVDVDDSRLRATKSTHYNSCITKRL